MNRKVHNFFQGFFTIGDIIFIAALFAMGVFLFGATLRKNISAAPQASVEISDVKSNGPVYTGVTEKGYPIVTMFAPASYTVNAVALGDNCRYYYPGGGLNGSAAYGSNIQKVQAYVANGKPAVYTMRCQSVIGGADVQKTLIVNVISPSEIRAPTLSAAVN
jgi:hypothetical protein